MLLHELKMKHDKIKKDTLHFCYTVINYKFSLLDDKRTL